MSHFPDEKEYPAPLLSGWCASEDHARCLANTHGRRVKTPEQLAMGGYYRCDCSCHENQKP